jgi:hypothetical protein
MEDSMADPRPDQTLDEAYQRLHACGPEFGDANPLANHGPMAVEVLVRRGFAGEVPGWLDFYVRRLEGLPTASDPIDDTEWQDAMGDPRRVGDWTAYFAHAVTEEPWRDTLRVWWPRLLPGIAASATHSVIRVGHALRTLLAGDESSEAVTELAYGLGYWAARAIQVPGATFASGELDVATALSRIPRIEVQSGVIRERLASLSAVPAWTESLSALKGTNDPDQARATITDLVTAATKQYLTHGHASPVLLVHAATAPNAVLHALPALPRELWPMSMSAAWIASAAVTAAYAPAAVAALVDPPAPPAGPDAATNVIERAAAHRDEHVIKFSDTAVEVYERTGDPDALAAAVHSARLIAPPS